MHELALVVTFFISCAGFAIAVRTHFTMRALQTDINDHREKGGFA